MKLRAEYDPKTKALYVVVVDREEDKHGTTIETPLYGIHAMDLTQGGEIQGYEFLDIELEVLDESNTDSSSEST